MLYHWQKDDQYPQKLVSFLSQRGFSKTQLKQLKFRHGQIYVNHHRRFFSYQLHYGDEIIVVLPQEQGSHKIAPIAGTLDILYEDDNYLIINKPAGLASLPVMNLTSATLANYVKYYLQTSDAENDAIHLVSRLDRDTSGIITFAKNAYAHSLLAGEFLTTAVNKEYDAIVSGHLAQSSGQICAPIGVDSNNHNLRCVAAAGKWALTKYRVVKTYPDFTWVRVKLITGRTHQIRVHFAYLGHPLIGDDAYGGATNLLQRQALHCSTFSFFNQISQQQVNITAPLAADLQQLLQRNSK
ncbi:RluA family pseudouridine synthase [Bombilactobacillus bombi]|uniref:RluA family pseudouridine synthase n=1 Tax=Bombilactobacillus bombi TaxID=1303590 RepID=UPI0015E5B57F|nr:RluA family pseudouridine synthase [Bombilactobacillus bombi]MBA1435036.1 RluA family pseudouridine synthase [Bombilactobacillus bombi]